jgi:TM2 domain-containing membrane protein YozV
MVICPDCAREVPKAKFCKNCGAYIANVEEAKPLVESETVANPVIAQQIEPAAEIESNVEIPVESGDVENSVSVPPSAKKARFCYNCGYELAGNFNFCPDCGQDLRGNIIKSNAKSPSGGKSIILAIILSVFLPGLGQIYLGLDHKGAIFLIAYVVSAILILLLIGFLLCPIIWLWALIDTIISTNALNRGDEVKDKLL